MITHRLDRVARVFFKGGLKRKKEGEGGMRASARSQKAERNPRPAARKPHKQLTPPLSPSLPDRNKVTQRKTHEKSFELFYNIIRKKVRTLLV